MIKTNYSASYKTIWNKRNYCEQKQIQATKTIRHENESLRQMKQAKATGIKLLKENWHQSLSAQYAI